MSYQDELSFETVDDGLLEPLSSLDATPIFSSAPQALTVYSPTVVSTVFVPESSGMATAISSSTPQSISSSSSSSTSHSSNSSNNGNSNQSSGGDRTTVIVLATVMSIIGCLLIAVGIWVFMRCRRRRSKLFSRGITPIGDDEIETWKGQRTEKGHDMDDGPHSPSQGGRTEDDKGHQKSESTTSIKKPPSVIVYARKSEEWSPRSPTMPDYPFSKTSLDIGKRSFEKELPMTPIQARAPNAREGLTDEAIPGDEPFVSSPKRRGSRLSKGTRYPNHAHSRTKSNRSSSSLHRLGDRVFGYESDDYRPSHEYYPGHSRVSSSQDPPRLSLAEDWPAGSGGLSAQPLAVRAEDIGRAIG